MEFTQLTPEDVTAMLSRLKADSVEDLYRTVPSEIRLGRPLELPRALSEPELLAALRRLSDANRPATRQTCFLGAGAYDHFIPTVVDAMAARGEFVTAYTPYQAEASQGALQAFYEYQTMICRLTGMEVSNASLYEGASAAAEAAIMAWHVSDKTRVVVSSALHPDTRAVLETYTRDLPLSLHAVDCPAGQTDTTGLATAVDGDTAAVLVQTPNFYGVIEPLDEIARIAHDAGAMLIVAVDPISCGLLKPPGAFGADIVVGEGQALGIPLQYGGPYLGFLACRREHLRQVPGRLVGLTHDADGRRGFCLTLQTREQHIRRERATSNVCTNQGLMALRAAVYLATVGRRGLSGIARRCLDKAHYAADRIAALDGFELAFADAPFFKEFAVRSRRRPVADVLATARERGVLAGVPLNRWCDRLDDCFLVAVTEKRTKAEIDALVDALAWA